MVTKGVKESHNLPLKMIVHTHKSLFLCCFAFLRVIVRNQDSQMIQFDLLIIILCIGVKQAELTAVTHVWIIIYLIYNGP